LEAEAEVEVEVEVEVAFVEGEQGQSQKVSAALVGILCPVMMTLRLHQVPQL